MDVKPQVELFGALNQLYQEREYADLTILTRDGARHAAHKAIVCPRSTFFADVVKHEQWNDDVEGEIYLSDDEPDIFLHVLEYLYLMDYEPRTRRQSMSSNASSHQNSDSVSVRTDPIHFGHVYGTSAVSAFGGPRDSISHHMPFSANFAHHRDRSESQLTVHALPGSDFPSLGGPGNPRRRTSRSTLNNAPDPSPLATREPHLVLHAKVYAAAERFGIGGLKSLALTKFKIQLTRHWDSSEFAESIHVAYNATTSSDKAMREAVADTISWHGQLLDQPEVEVAIMEINGLAYELLKRSRRTESDYD